MRDILETELPPLPADDRPDSRTNERSSAFDYSRGGSASYAEFSEYGTLHLRDRRAATRRAHPDDVDEEERFLPTQAAIASTPRRGGDSHSLGIVSPNRESIPRLSNHPSTPVHMGGFDLYERGVDAVHSATAAWRRSPSPMRARSPYSPAFAANLRAASAPPSRSSGGRLRTSPSSSIPVSLGFRARDDAEAAYVARIRGARSNPRAFRGGDGWADSTKRRPAWGGGGGGVVSSTWGSDGHGSRARTRLAFDPDARARAERAAAVAAAAERKAVERMEAARSRRRTNGGGQSGGAAWQPLPSAGTTKPVPSPGRTSASSKSTSRWEESEKVEDRLRRDWVLREARREATHAERIQLERVKTNPFAVRHPTNASPARLAAHGRHLHARGEQRRARIERAHASASPAQLASPPVGMGGEESVAFRGMTNVSRALMEDRAHEDFLQRQSSALKKRDAKMEETRRVKEAEALKKEEDAMRSTPVITKTASAMRRSVDDLRAWQDRKNASVRELRRRRDEYEDRVHNTFAPRMSKGSVAIERERRNAALGKYRPTGHSPGHSPVTSSHKSPVSNDEPGRRERGHELFDDGQTSGGVTLGVTTRQGDAFSPEPRVRNLHTAPTPTPMTRRVASNTGGSSGADAMAAVLAGAAMAGAAALASARTTTAGAAKPEAAAAGARANTAGESGTFPPSGTGRRTSTRNSMGTSIRNSVRVPRAAAGHYTRNPAAVPPVAMTLDDERSVTFTPRITAMAASLRRSGDFGDRMYKAAVEAANEKASASPGGTKRRGPRGVNAGARSSGVDSHRGPSDLPTGGDDTWGPARLELTHASPVVSVGTPARARRRSSSVLEALARRKSVGPESSPGLRGRSRATKRLDHRQVGDATATEGEGEYWTAAGEDSGAEFGDLGTDPDAFVATARRGRETDAAWGHALLREGA